MPSVVVSSRWARRILREQGRTPAVGSLRTEERLGSVTICRSPSVTGVGQRALTYNTGCLPPTVGTSSLGRLSGDDVLGPGRSPVFSTSVQPSSRVTACPAVSVNVSHRRSPSVFSSEREPAAADGYYGGAVTSAQEDYIVLDEELLVAESLLPGTRSSACSVVETSVYNARASGVVDNNSARDVDYPVRSSTFTQPARKHVLPPNRESALLNWLVGEVRREASSGAVAAAELTDTREGARHSSVRHCEEGTSSGVRGRPHYRDRSLERSAAGHWPGGTPPVTSGFDRLPERYAAGHSPGGTLPVTSDNDRSSVGHCRRSQERYAAGHWPSGTPPVIGNHDRESASHHRSVDRLTAGRQQECSELLIVHEQTPAGHHRPDDREPNSHHRSSGGILEGNGRRLRQRRHRRCSSSSSDGSSSRSGSTSSRSRRKRETRRRRRRRSSSGSMPSTPGRGVPPAGGRDDGGSSDFNGSNGRGGGPPKGPGRSTPRHQQQGGNVGNATTATTETRRVTSNYVSNRLGKYDGTTCLETFLARFIPVSLYGME